LIKEWKSEPLVPASFVSNLLPWSTGKKNIDSSSPPLLRAHVMISKRLEIRVREQYTDWSQGAIYRLTQ
jgi:hypothetical protein